MEVVFSGICLWERTSRSPALLGIMPNVTSGHSHGGTTITPPHTACILALPADVDTAGSTWPEAPTPVTIDHVPHLLYPLDGDEIAFDPSPTGGSPSMTLVPPKGVSVLTHVVKPSMTGTTPSASEVIARIDLPGTAQLNVTPNSHDAKFTTLTVADGTKLVSTRNSTTRTLKFQGSNPVIIVANIDLTAAQSGSTPFEDHGEIYLSMFDPIVVGVVALHATHAAAPPLRAAPPLSAILARFQENQQLGDQLTIGPGCSNTQFP